MTHKDSATKIWDFKTLRLASCKHPGVHLSVTTSGRCRRWAEWLTCRHADYDWRRC